MRTNAQKTAFTCGILGRHVLVWQRKPNLRRAREHEMIDGSMHHRTIVLVFTRHHRHGQLWRLEQPTTTSIHSRIQNIARVLLLIHIIYILIIIFCFLYCYCY